MEYIICIYIPSVQTSRPEGLFRSGGRRGTLWDTDAHTEHLHRPAPQKSRAQRVHIQ